LTDRFYFYRNLAVRVALHGIDDRRQRHDGPTAKQAADRRRAGDPQNSLGDTVCRAMKKAAGITPLTLVLADEGKNGLVGPAPSPFIVAGAVAGFSMRYVARHRSARPLRASRCADRRSEHERHHDADRPCGERRPPPAARSATTRA